jgi:hypothetical protein
MEADTYHHQRLMWRVTVLQGPSFATAASDHLRCVNIGFTAVSLGFLSGGSHNAAEVTFVTPRYASGVLQTDYWNFNKGIDLNWLIYCPRVSVEVRSEAVSCDVDCLQRNERCCVQLAFQLQPDNKRCIACNVITVSPDVCSKVSMQWPVR